MKRMYFRFFQFLLLAGSAGFLSCHEPAKKQADETRPNIVLILADDLGCNDLSCYGQSILSTPNLDEMASQGMMFTNHYTGNTVCAPSRACLLTGKHPGHASVRGNQPDQLLLDEEVTVAEKLKEAGYVTGAIGKWGVGHPPSPTDPQRNGFDHFYGYINMWHAHNFYPEFLYRNGKKERLDNKLIHVDGKNPWADQPEGTGVAEVKNTHVHGLFDKEALSFIENNKDTTFFLYMAYNVPHANNEAGNYLKDGMEVPDYGRFTDEEWPNPEKGFAKMIENLDHSVKLINDKLEELGLAENTLVIFASDNGPHQEGNHTMEFFNSNGDYVGMKRDLYEGGLKTPFIAKWPGTVKAGSKTDHLSAFWDLLPTFADIAGASPVKESDGISFLPVLLGDEVNQVKHEYLYWEFYELGGRQAVRKDNWKAVKLNVRTGNPMPLELFDLSTDPFEQNNVAADHPEVVAEMERILKEAHVPVPFMSLFDNEISADTPF